MKRIILSSFIALGVLAFTSCKKDYTCECTTTTAGVSATASTTITDTKKNATESCDAGDATTTVGGITATTECEIK
ncbi:MAG: hypothetical protein MI810_15400 [Flavobacteriales bacterium]|nr:hypothetical protein [Flavobacteriales bacterium]